ncbi:MAG: adenylyltransferase/cytidyltransferase family protein [bacterium]|nr:adenylyltransferase/cytidyltransferase family protein [bacterium]
MTDLHPDSMKALLNIREKFAKREKIVFVSGNFNIVHPGHLRMLRFASECGDCLIAGVYSDATGNAVMPENLRLEGVKSTTWVDTAFILRDAPEKFIEHLKPAIIVKGKEHENQRSPELEAVKSYGGKLLFSSGDVTFSSVSLLHDELKRLNSSTIIKPKDFLHRHGITKADLKSALQKFHWLNIVVIGDIIVDEYITCDPVGMSQEDPTIVVTPLLNQKFVGGAGIVAAHAQGLGAVVNFFSVVGKDETADYARNQLDKYEVNSHLYEDESRPTIRKQRFRANGKTLLRVNHLRHHGINRDIQEAFLRDLSVILNNTQLVIFSDFNYGCLPQPLVDEIMSLCRQKNILAVADSQSSSQVGDVSRFKGMALLTPTEREARLAMQDFNSGLVVLADYLRKKAQAQNIFMTLGKEGILIHAEVSETNEWLTDRLQAMNTSPVDIVGAGDSLLTCSSMAMAAGCGIWQSAYLGSLAAACQVARLGNIPLSSSDLGREIDL